MIAFTQSGYPVIAAYGDPRIAKTSPVNAAPGVLDELVPIFEWVMDLFDRTVAPLIASQCWGYAPRQIRGGTGWSNHASGTAVDLNATMFPQGKRYMSKAQIGACRNIVRQSGGAIRWGGDYSGSTAVDQQHFEIASIAAARAFIARLKAKPTQGDDDMKADDKLKFRDAYLGAKNPKDVDQTLTVAQGIQRAYNYGSVALRDLAQYAAELSALRAEVEALKKGTKA